MEQEHKGRPELRVVGKEEAVMAKGGEGGVDAEATLPDEIVLDGGSFADVPMTMGELRADKRNDSRAWSPRDALIETLRMIDRGELDLDSILIVQFEVAERDSEGRPTQDVVHYTMAGQQTGTFMLGVLDRVKAGMMQNFH